METQLAIGLGEKKFLGQIVLGNFGGNAALHAHRSVSVSHNVKIVAKYIYMSYSYTTKLKLRGRNISLKG